MSEREKIASELRIFADSYGSAVEAAWRRNEAVTSLHLLRGQDALRRLKDLVQALPDSGEHLGEGER